jgi:SRSO17 transposase
MEQSMTEADSDWLEQLDDYVDLFREDFRRRDQIRWASVYLQGLLREVPTKTIGAMARQVLLPPDLMVEDVAQALQNFVNQSPWDEQKLWRRHRQLQQARLTDAEGTFVLEDLALVKQGRHSVGVQRQYSGVLARKTNCQIVVMLSHLSSAGPCPLGLRLYLPRTWLQSPTRLDSVGVPEEFRSTQTRGSIALELLDAARGEGWPGRRVLASAGLGTDPTFRQELRRRELDYLIETAGLDLPLEADDALIPLPASTPDLGGTHFLTNRSPQGPNQADRLATEREQVQQARRLLLDELGLDHFEGRSWRGLHHHACLVMLAYSFRMLRPECLNHTPSSAI